MHETCPTCGGPAERVRKEHKHHDGSGSDSLVYHGYQYHSVDSLTGILCQAIITTIKTDDIKYCVDVLKLVEAAVKIGPESDQSDLHEESLR